MQSSEGRLFHVVDPNTEKARQVCLEIQNEDFCCTSDTELEQSSVMCVADSIDSFKTALKTYLLSRAYSVVS